MRSRWIAALFVGAAVAGCAEPASPDGHSVVLITLDTTRADAFAAFGGARDVAPNLDALAEESVCFVRAHTVAPLTLPAHASMLTGLYPPRHGVRANGPAQLPLAAETLAERALRAGHQTAAFVGALALDRAYGVAQGFEAWTQPEPSAERVVGQISDRPASQVVFDARSWLAQRDHRRPFFLWVHLFDPHAPYAAAPEFVERAGGHAYYGEVASMDAQLGALIGQLRDEGFLERGLVCVVGDHGEGLGDHGEDTHGQHVWESTLHVPLFLRLPGGERGGERREEFASVVDVAPTLAEAMGLGPMRRVDGLSLLSERLPDGRGTYFESLSGWARFRWSPLCGWIGPEGKYVHSSEPRFSDLTDPTEQRDRSSELPGAVERARAAIRAVLEAPRLEHGSLAPTSNGNAALAALGYGDAGELEPEYPDPLEPSELPSPDARIAEYRSFVAAQSLHQLGRNVEAAERLESLLAANPRSVHALDELAAVLVELERWERAIAVLRERLQFRPDRLSTHQLLVQCFTATGDAAGVRLHTERALELLAEMHERRGEAVEARRYRDLLGQGAPGGR